MAGMTGYRAVLLIGFGVVSLWLSPTQLWAADKKTVLVIESYHASYPWDKDYTQALRQQLELQAELHFEQLDTKRLPRDQYQAQADRIWQRFLQLKPDLVVTGDDNALRLLGPRVVATDTPLIYLGINANPRSYFERIPSNVSGILERPLFKRSILYIHRIMDAKLTRILVLFDDGTTSRALLEEEFSGALQVQLGPVQVDIQLIGSESEWHQTISESKQQGYDAVVVGLYHTLTDNEGNHVPDQQIIEWTSEHTPLPLFAYWKFAVGEKMTAGGYVLDGYTQGLLAAELVKDALAGKPLPRMPSSSGEGRFVFSRSQLHRWQLELPPSIADQALIVP